MASRRQTYRTNVAWRAPEDLGGFEDVTYEAEVEREGRSSLSLRWRTLPDPAQTREGQTYTVRVYAVNADGRSGAAEIVLEVPVESRRMAVMATIRASSLVRGEDQRGHAEVWCCG